MLSERYLAKFEICHTPRLHTRSIEEQKANLDIIYSVHLARFPFHNLELKAVGQQHPLMRQTLRLFSRWEPTAQGDNAIQGGFCFQSVQLLYHVLKELGYSVIRCQARILNGMAVNAPALLAMPATHVLLVVKLGDQHYLLDPGLGSKAPREPLLINYSAQPIRQGNGSCKFYLHESGVYVYERKQADQWIPLMQTDLRSVTEAELQFSLLKLERHPLEIAIRDSKVVIGVMTPKGAKTLYWDNTSRMFVLTIEEGRFHDKYLLRGAVQAERVLRSQFNITHISATQLREYCSDKRMTTPKRRWSLSFPLDKNEIRRLQQGLNQERHAVRPTTKTKP